MTERVNICGQTEERDSSYVQYGLFYAKVRLSYINTLLFLIIHGNSND